MPSHPLSRLDTDRQQYVSACCRDFHSRLQQHAPHLLEEQIQKAPADARFALLCELLPIEIEHGKLSTGRLPTLHELCHSHPKLKEYLPKAYVWVAVPVVPAIALALGAAWMGMKSGSAPAHFLAGEELWVERTARELGINLDEISANDFQVTFEPVDYAIVGAAQLPGSKTDIRIGVTAGQPLEELLGEVEYRIGDCPWRNLTEGRIDGRSCNRLERREVEADGPVELRIDSLRDSGSGKVWGPYRYDVSIRDALEQHQGRSGKQAAADWNQPRQEWIVETADGWQLRPGIEYLTPSYVKAIQFGKAADDLRVTIPLNEQERNFQFSAMADFRTGARVFGDADAIYVRLVFPDGSHSATREFRRSKPSRDDELFQ